MFNSAYLLKQKTKKAKKTTKTKKTKTTKQTKKNFVLQWALITKRIIEVSNSSSRNISNHKLNLTVVRFVIELRNLLSELITSKVELCQKHLWRLLSEFIAQRNKKVLSMLYSCWFENLLCRSYRFFSRLTSRLCAEKKKKKKEKDEMCDLYKRQSALWFSRRKLYSHETMICELRFMRYVLNSTLTFARHIRTTVFCFTFCIVIRFIFSKIDHRREKKKEKKMKCVIYINVNQRCDFHVENFIYTKRWYVNFGLCDMCWIQLWLLFIITMIFVV